MCLSAKSDLKNKIQSPCIACLKPDLSRRKQVQNRKILHYTGILLLCNEYRDIFLYRFRLCDFYSKPKRTTASSVLVFYVILEYGFCGEYTLIWLYIGKEISKSMQKINQDWHSREIERHTRWKNIDMRIAAITGFKTHTGIDQHAPRRHKMIIKHLLTAVGL